MPPGCRRDVMAHGQPRATAAAAAGTPPGRRQDIAGTPPGRRRDAAGMPPGRDGTWPAASPAAAAAGAPPGRRRDTAGASVPAADQKGGVVLSSRGVLQISCRPEVFVKFLVAQRCISNFFSPRGVLQISCRPEVYFKFLVAQRCSSNFLSPRGEQGSRTNLSCLGPAWEVWRSFPMGANWSLSVWGEMAWVRPTAAGA